MEDGVWDSSLVGLEGFKDEEEALVVGRDESGEGGDFLKRLVILYAGKFERSYQRCKTFGAKSYLLLEVSSDGLED